MGIEVNWLESRILLYRLVPPFTWEELNQSLSQAINLVKAVPDQKVGTLLEVKGIISIPHGSLQRGSQVLKLKPPNAGPVVLVQAHPVIKAFCGMVKMLHPPIGKLIYFADDRASGLLLLRRVLKTKRPVQE